MKGQNRDIGGTMETTKRQPGDKGGTFQDEPHKNYNRPQSNFLNTLILGAATWAAFWFFMGALGCWSGKHGTANIHEGLFGRQAAEVLKSEDSKNNQLP